MELIDDQPLDPFWLRLREKASIADEVADIILKLSEIHLVSIGGVGSLNLEHNLGIAFESLELLKGSTRRESQSLF